MLHLTKGEFNILHVRLKCDNGGEGGGDGVCVCSSSSTDVVGSGVLGRAVHPFAIYPQNKHYKRGQNLA